MIDIPCRYLMHQQQDLGRRMHRVAGLAPIYEKHQIRQSCHQPALASPDAP